MTFGLQKPNNITHLFGSWLNGFRGGYKYLILLGISALCWAIWLCRNDIVFDKAKKQTCLHILFRATYLTRSWAILQKEEDRETVALACRALETTAMEIFAAMDGSLETGFASNLFFIEAVREFSFVLCGTL